ncbi:MAG: zinc ribbon domain-containing protein [Desulfobacteraceae bacterium]|nr:zinc ribbon domain-containing protein [Desulfobacteraceae bacterium]
MICPKCHQVQEDGRTECAACGIIFAKIRSHPDPPAPGDELAAQPVESEQDRAAVLKALFFPKPADPNSLIVGLKALLLLVLAIWSCKFIFASIESNVVGESFMHLVNLPFHEAGHIIFSPLGRFLQVLGGTLGQLLMPAICAGVLLLQTRDAFGAAVALWWLAESFMDIAPYINDARALKLVLLGGVTGQDVADYHDWEYLLGTLRLLKMDHALAYLAQGMGIVLMIAALAWAGVNLWVQFKARNFTS